jgi:hypothetical protein
LTDAVVTSASDVETHAGQRVHVEGTYRQQDVRMRPVDPATLHVGHVAIVLDDGTRVYLYPPEDPEARRPADEIAQFENRRVRVAGVLLPTIPSDNTAIIAPCLLDTGDVTLAPD